MDPFKTLAISASGLEAQRTRLETIASNMANARTTRTEDGGPYRRRVPVFEAVPGDPFGDLLAQNMSSVRVSDVALDNSSPVMVHDPGHPDADAEGYVSYPAVNVLQEMVDLMETSRAFEANTKVVEVTRSLVDSALGIGR